MANGRPPWRVVLDHAERGIGVPLETIVRSEPYFDAVALGTRVRRGTTTQLERLTRRCLHLCNLPAGSDIRRLNDQMARMERRVVSMSKQLESEGRLVHDRVAA